MSPWLQRLLISPPRYRDLSPLRAHLSGKTVLITGASFGIGEATALLFAKAGARLILIARTAEKLEQLHHEITAQGGEVSSYPADLSQISAIPELVMRIQKIHPRIDIVICNAGKSIYRSVLESSRGNDVERLLALNFRSPAALVLALLPRFVAQGGAQIIHSSSLSSRLPSAPRWGSYHSSKAGFDIWLQALGNELRSQNIRVTSVYLPLVRTRMIVPTRHYDALPALSPHEAAQVMAFAVVHPSNQLAPWWLGGAECLSVILSNPISYLLSLWDARRAD